MRKLLVAATAALFLAIASPVSAAKFDKPYSWTEAIASSPCHIPLRPACASTTLKRVEGEATLTIDDPTPEYGQVITLTATTNVAPTYIHVVCEQDGEIVGVSFSPYSNSTGYDDDVGLYSPAWTGGAATCTAEVVWITRHGPDRSLTEFVFAVAA